LGRGRLMKIAAGTRNPVWPAAASRGAGILILLLGVLLAAGLCIAGPRENPVPSIFEPHSTPADSIRHLSHFVLGRGALMWALRHACLPCPGSNDLHNTSRTGIMPKAAFRTGKDLNSGLAWD
jgi:hypothetical protein